MKKFIFAAFVTLSAVFAFTSCAEDVKIGLSDIAGQTFEGTSEILETTTTLVFSDDSFSTVTMSVDGVETGNGTYVVNSENEVIITWTVYGGEPTVKIETLTGDGKNKLIYGSTTLKKK